MSEPDLVETGIAGLDAILSAGIPHGNVILVEGAIWQEMLKAESLFLEEAARIDARRLFVDGVAGVVGRVEGVDPRDAFHALVAGLQRENMTAVLAVEAGCGLTPQLTGWCWAT